MTTALYNDNEPFAAGWLEALIDHGHIAPGRVDRRSIADLTPADVAGAGQRHFFAGIGGWSAALRLAGVADDAGVWTGSCPCQPFSDAGKGGGTGDARHLWPAWFALIEQRRPPIIFGEQVASADGLGWLDVVSADLERCGYAVGAADLCAASVGAPHIRQRLFFVAYSDGEPGRLLLRQWRSRHAHAEAGRRGEDSRVADAAGQRGGRRRERAPHRREALEPPGRGDSGLLADRDREGLEVRGEQQARRQRQTPQRGGEVGVMGDPGSTGSTGSGRDSGTVPGPEARGESGGQGHRLVGDLPLPAGATGGFWHPADWLLCRDPSGGAPVARPVEPGTFPLAHGVPERVGLLSGYGNAIVPQVAAAFIVASLEALSDRIA